MPTQKEIDIYEELKPKIASIRDTIKALSAKKPDELLNIFKIRRINILMEQANALLKDVKPIRILIHSKRMNSPPIAMYL